MNPTPQADVKHHQRRAPKFTSAEIGPLGVLHLKRFWSKSILDRNGELEEAYQTADWNLDVTLLDGLGLELEGAIRYVYQENPSYEQFEKWIIDRHGGPLRADVVDSVNAVLRRLLDGDSSESGTSTPDLDANVERILSDDDKRCWSENGYVVIHNAIPMELCKAMEDAVWDFLDMDRDDPDTWYRPRDNAGIMLPLYQHEAQLAIRITPRVRQAFAEIWDTSELMMSVDRVSFNVPERPGFEFQGPDLHWDTDLTPPVEFGVQGLIYLTDTEPEQGAFTCVPGFHKRVDDWLRQLPPEADPQQQDLEALGQKPVAGQAGDLVIWHQALPHGSRPNHATRPRIVQYVKMYPKVNRQKVRGKSTSIESLRLPLNFDRDRLKGELGRLASREWTRHFNTRDYEGDWSGIPLRKPADAAHPIQALFASPGTSDFVDTEELEACDYIREVIESFHCPLNSVRLLRLKSGAIIKEHTDDGLRFEEGEARIHVPIVTNDDIEFILNGKRLFMGEGEAWYTNVNLPHSVFNRAAIDRVHLVIDCKVNDWLRELFTRAM